MLLAPVPSEAASTRRVSRRSIFAGAVASLATMPAFAEGCRLGPAPHQKGPAVFMDYDQEDLDAAYDQEFYEPMIGQASKRIASASATARARIRPPERKSYGPSSVEHLDIYRASRDGAPIFVFIHGGTWRFGSALNTAYAAETFINKGAHFVTLDFSNVQDVGGDLTVMATQVRRAVAWVYQNAASFGGNANRLYVGGHSSGGHLCGVALVTDWKSDFGLPADAVKGGLCISGMYDMKPVRISKRGGYVKFTDASESAMSPIRHIDRLTAPTVVTYGTFETPEFQRQNRDFAQAIKAQGKPVTVIEVPNYTHMGMAESLGNPYGPCGHAALQMMGLAES